MPDLRKEVALICVADLHLSLEAPKARAEKGDAWLEVQAGYLKQLRDLQESLVDDTGTAYNRPAIAYAGDVFNSWDEKPELVNWAIKHVPKGYAVAGNHELPYHRYADVNKSCYWTLVEAGVLENIEPNEYRFEPRMILHGWPYGSKVLPNDRSMGDEEAMHVALIHDYCWTTGGFGGHPNADPNKRASEWHLRLKGYDVAVFGDNHVGFEYNTTKPIILNCGAFIRRSAAESIYRPHVGVVYTDGTVDRLPLTIHEDKWDVGELAEAEPDTDFNSKELEELMRSLRTSKSQRTDFAKILLRSLDDARLGALAKGLIIEALEQSK